MGFALSVLILVGLGASAAAGLALADRYFGVEEDPRLDALSDALPNANCGGCGYPGCRAYAQALLAGEDITLCAPGGNASVQRIAEILGTEAVAVVERVAIVKCAGTAAVTSNRAKYLGITDCAAANLVAGGPAECPDGCLGLGSCIAACEYDAIEIRNGVAVILPERCIGDGLCVKACPRHLIELVPKDRKVHVLCSNHQPGKEVRKICSVGCTGCKLCTKTSSSFTMDGDLAILGDEVDERAAEAALVCPTGTILDQNMFSARELVFDPEARRRLKERQAEYKKQQREAKKKAAAAKKAAEAKKAVETNEPADDADHKDEQKVTS
ncbi:MAG: RnfABCDGE type electron transport complex subunit B [Deltaproteobacteria bacterium]|nr:RnfABCDGE type electron transport complex subunit B [Deltaproteobacteria bacterium]